LDHNAFYINPVRRSLELSGLIQEQELLVEISSFLTHYLQSKECLVGGYCLDAYSNILHALHHWAHLAIIEEGAQPELTVWRQVRSINPGIYKLYEELTLNNETVEKRVELVILACEFSVISKIVNYSRLLFRIIESREEAWSVVELRNHPDLRHIHFNLPLLLARLIKKSFLREVRDSLGDETTLRYTY